MLASWIAICNSLAEDSERQSSRRFHPTSMISRRGVESIVLLQYRRLEFKICDQSHVGTSMCPCHDDQVFKRSLA
jgi:hypothetical protein